VARRSLTKDIELRKQATKHKSISTLQFKLTRLGQDQTLATRLFSEHTPVPMDHSRRRVLRALAQANIAVSDFSATMHAATEGDEGAVVYRSMSGADNAPLLVDHAAYAFLKNPPADKMGPYFKNVSELADTVCTLMSSMPSEAGRRNARAVELTGSGAADGWWSKIPHPP